jgi:hypothetical protein
MNIKVTPGKFEKCEDCALGKIKHTKISKENKNKLTKPAERIYIDISSIKARSKGGRK